MRWKDYESIVLSNIKEINQHVKQGKMYYLMTKFRFFFSFNTVLFYKRPQLMDFLQIFSELIVSSRPSL